MTERERIYSALSRLAWGYVLLYFDFKLGTVSVTPAFVGYLLFLSGLGPLSEQRRSLALLRPLGILLAAWNGANWLFSWVGGTLDGIFPFLDVLVAAAAIYFHFQLLTDLASLASEYQEPGQELDRRILRWRTVNVVIQTATPLLYHLLRGVEEEGVTVVVVAALLAASFIMMVCITACLFSLRKLFRTTLSDKKK